MKTSRSKKEKRSIFDMPFLVEKRNNEPSQYQQRELLREDYKWIAAQDEFLRQKYLNMYVAVRNKKVLIASDNAYKLLDDLKAEGISASDTAIKFLSANPTCFLL